MKKSICIFIFSLFTYYSVDSAKPYPISFSISETKIVKQIPEKTMDFSTLIPGDYRTYSFDNEEDYYKHYQRCYYAYTWKKGGWDCLRHYEILANGCIPYFTDLDHCPAETMHLFPKKLIKKAMNIRGVSRGNIDHSIFDYDQYYEILEQLLEYTRNHLSAAKIAEYVLQQVGYEGTGKILFLSNDSNPDYLKTCLLIGMKELLGDRVIDFPKNDYIYTNYPDDVKKLYGKGFSYTRIVPDLPINRNNVAQRIINKEFDLIIYSHIHFGIKFHNLIKQYYAPNEVIYTCGQDAHRCPYKHLNNLFLREYDS